MATNSIQFSKLIDRLLLRTTDQTIRWSQTAESGRYQVRFGDFAISIAPVPTANKVERDLVLQVNRISGIAVGAVSTSQSAVMAIIHNATQVDPLSAANLRRLYELLADRSDDLDELLKLV